MINQMLIKLTSNYNTSENSNIYKLFSIIAAEMTEIEDTMEKIRKWRDIDTAEGRVLDRIGTNVLQHRLGFNDEVYRVFLKTRIARNMADSTINNIIDVLNIAFEDKGANIGVNEYERANIGIKGISIDKVYSYGLEPQDVFDIIIDLAAAGVNIRDIDFTGSFKFQEEENLDSDFGFSDIEMTFGGSLGGMFINKGDHNFEILK